MSRIAGVIRADAEHRPNEVYVPFGLEPISEQLRARIRGTGFDPA